MLCVGIDLILRPMNSISCGNCLSGNYVSAKPKQGDPFCAQQPSPQPLLLYRSFFPSFIIHFYIAGVAFAKLLYTAARILERSTKRPFVCVCPPLVPGRSPESNRTRALQMVLHCWLWTTFYHCTGEFCCSWIHPPRRRKTTVCKGRLWIMWK